MKYQIKNLIGVIMFLPFIVNAQFTDQGTYLTTSKNVTIGTNTDLYSFHVAKQQQKWQGFFSNANGGDGSRVYLSHGAGYGMLIKTYTLGNEYSLKMQNSDGDTNNFLNNGNVELGLAGNVGIGTTNPQNKLDVCGIIRAKEILVEDTAWCDFVFEPEYCLTTLEEEETFIKLYGHLSNFESAKAMNGEINVNDIFKRQQIQIEENVLHLIELNEENKVLQTEVDELKAGYALVLKELAELKAKLN